MRIFVSTCLASWMAFACSGSEVTGSASTGGTVNSAGGGGTTIVSSGGTISSGGTTAAVVTPQAGGATPVGTTVSSTGGTASTSTSTPSATGGLTSTGGTTNASGGSKALGGTSSSGGSKALGGSSSSGGSKAVGGTSSTGGTASTGGSKAMGGTSSAGGTGGSSAYQPCPTNGDACIILPFGDSITDGVGSTDAAGYRSALFKLIVAASQKINFVGSRSGGPAQVSGVTFPKKHEGHPGWTIDSGYVSFGDGISTLIPTPAFSTIPHIVLLMIGTNDISATTGTDKIADRLDVLLGKIVTAAPKALLVVAQVTPIRWNPAALTTYNSKIPTLVQTRAKAGQHIVAVDMSKMPTSAQATDGLHPNDTGYAYMADTWYAAIKTYLPK